MKKIRLTYLIIGLTIILTSCSAQNKIRLSKLVYHSSRCFGTCPQVDMQIDSNRNIYVNREYFKNKSEAGEGSGQFKGVLDKPTYDTLLKKLKKSDYRKLDFPDVTCCDGVITTIIIYEKGKRTYLKSMMPPAEASELIAFLYKLGLETSLERTRDKIELED